MLIPDGNKREIEELPEVVKKEITFIPVKRVDEVFDVVFAVDNGYQQPTADKPKRARKAKIVPPVLNTPQSDSVRCKTSK